MVEHSNSHPVSEEDGLHSSDNALLAERFDEFKEALETLYILANMAGRNNFNKAWPLVAQRVLGAELIDYDLNGAKDLERRSELEVEAETRRIELLEALDGVEDKSVHAGALQIEYVQQLVGSLGRELALYVYAKPIVDRFIPPSAEEAGGAAVQPAEQGKPVRSRDEAISDSDFETMVDLGRSEGEPLIQEFKMEDEQASSENAEGRRAPPSVSAKPRTAADADTPAAPEAFFEEEEDSLIRPIDTSTPQGHAAFDELSVGAERPLSPLEIEQAKLMEQKREPEAAPEAPAETPAAPEAAEVEDTPPPRSEDEALQPMTFMSARKPKE